MIMELSDFIMLAAILVGCALACHLAIKWSGATEEDIRNSSGCSCGAHGGCAGCGSAGSAGCPSDAENCDILKNKPSKQ